MAVQRPDRLMARAAVVLVRPQIPENIGSVARVMANLGLGRLILVRPRSWKLDRMWALATRLGREIIIDRVELVPDLEPALAGFQLVIGSSARGGRFRGAPRLPREVLEPASAKLAETEIALVFGPEKDGLTNEELKLCHQVVRIPTSREAGSLNLAQAVMVLGYELRTAVLNLEPNSGGGPKWADTASREGMFRHLEETLDLIDPQAHFNRRVWINAFRRLFGRTNLRPHEVRLIRGACRKIGYAVRSGAGSGTDPGEKGGDG